MEYIVHHIGEKKNLYKRVSTLKEARMIAYDHIRSVPFIRMSKYPNVYIYKSTQKGYVEFLWDNGDDTVGLRKTGDKSIYKLSKSGVVSKVAPVTYGKTYWS